MADIASVRLLNRHGQVRTVAAMTTLFDLCLVVVDGLRPASARALTPVIDRIDRTLSGSDCTVGVLAVGVTAAEAVDLFGPLAQRVAIFTDPDGTAAADLGVTGAPGLLWISTEPAVRAAVTGWDPTLWRPVLVDLARKLAWTRPLMPAPGDPEPVPAAPLTITQTSSPKEVHDAQHAA